MTISSTQDNGKNRLKSLIFRLLAAVFWLLVWQLAAVLVGKEILLPTPIAVIGRLFELGGTVKLWTDTFSSLGRIMAGFGLGLLTGTVLGFLAYKLKFVRILISPLLTVVKATPVASFIILALVWLTRLHVPAFIAFLMVLPIVTENTVTALGMTDRKLIEMENLFGFSFRRKCATLYFPSFSPYLFSSVKTSLGLSWKAGIAAEVLCTPVGSIGKNLYESKIYLETIDVFAWTVVVVIMSLILEKAITKLLELLFRKVGVLYDKH